MKTIELIALLTPKELKKFEYSVIKTHKRISLQKLYFHLKKNKSADKESVFTKIFDSAYSPKKDALFRNELRLLNKELELFLVEVAWKKQLELNSNETQLSLIKVYLERNEFNLFEQYWNKLYKKAQSERLYTLKIELIQLFFDYRIQCTEINFDLYQQLKVLLEEALLATVAQMQEEYKQLEVKDAFIQRNLYALSGKTYSLQSIPTPYNIAVPLENDRIIQYLDCNIQSYFLEGQPKIALLQKALSYADTLHNHKKYKTLASSLLTTETAIGLEYFLLKEYQKADEVYSNVLKKDDLILPSKKPAIYFNYIGNLICLGAYQRAIDWYESSGDDWKKSLYIAYRIQYFLCWAYIMLEEYQKPLDLLLDHNIQQRPENDFIYARLLLTIVYYSNQQLDLAEREVYNLIQNNRYKTPKEIVYIEYSKLLYQHIQAINLVDKEKQKNKLALVQQNLDTLYESSYQLISTMLYTWLSNSNKQK